VTAGEILCTYIKRNLFDANAWSELSSSLYSTGRGEQWSEFVEEVVATQLACRFVTAGSSIAESLGGKKCVGELLFRQEMRSITTETMACSLDRKIRARLDDLIERAVLATYGSVSDADKMLLRAEVGKRPRCYLCNSFLELRLDSVLFPTDEQKKRVIEYEHVWPRAFGGDTIIDNLALSCHDCNNRKASYANWSMVDIQSLVLAHNPSDESLAKIPGLRRFAMLSYAAHRIADKGSLSLKSAHLRLQHEVITPKLRRTTDVADFFNLINYSETV